MSEALPAWVARQGGAVHTSTVRDAGYGARAIAAAVARGDLDRVRRSWVVTPSCSTARRVAAAVSGRLTCVSAASERGFWTPPSPRPHVWVPRSASRLPTDAAILHRATPPAAVARWDATEPVLNILFHVARCLPRADALAVWESALRARAVEADELTRIRWRSSRAAEFARVARILSDSGLETHFCELMAGIGVVVRQQVWIDGHPVDGLIGDLLVVQIDGFAHHRKAADRRRDLRQDARLVLRGYTVLRFDYAQVLFEHAYVVDVVRTAMAQGRHRAH
ncbi:endonuclease domain-containing protein [Microbacterium enclense]|uniref:endonuclease domain-containing protein n=1 Tax=Microbacterium enclense TaxID=993073 RepID=UPI0036D75FB5